jgi:GTPase SAR1 family protein
LIARMSVEREFNLCVLGCAEVGKTSIVRTLSGIPFSRKGKCPSADEDEATRYAIEVNTSSGLMLLNLYDWNWEVQKRDKNINGQLMKVLVILAKQ